VVSTIRHGDITNEYNEGANCFRNYLRYAEAVSQADLAAAQRVLNGVSRWREVAADGERTTGDAVVEQLAEALRSRGFVVELGLGQSHSRVDLAVRRPADAAYRLGIAVDSHASYEQSDPLERDMMRPRLLRSFGWRVESVLAKDWYEDADKELERLVKLLEGEEPPPESTAPDAEEPDESDEPDRANEAGPPPAAKRVDFAVGTMLEPGPGDEPDVEESSPVAVVDAADAVDAPGVASARLVDDVQPGSLRLEYRQGTSSKFWEVRVHGTQLTVRFGRIGSHGQTRTKMFANESAAQTHAERLIAEKRGKGYRDAPES
jgi:predicted DNA-binding WGR domain protein